MLLRRYEITENPVSFEKEKLYRYDNGQNKGCIFYLGVNLEKIK